MGSVCSTCCPADGTPDDAGVVLSSAPGAQPAQTSQPQAPSRRASLPAGPEDGDALDFAQAIALDPRRPSAEAPPPSPSASRKRNSFSAWLASGLLASRSPPLSAPPAPAGPPDERQARRTAKIFMCGAGESGKSTIVKQMKVIHSGGFSPDEALDFRPAVFRDVHGSLLAMLDHVDGAALMRDERTLAAAWHVRRLRPASWAALERLPETYVDAAAHLWVEVLRASFDDIVRAGHARETAAYFLDDLARVGAPGFVPSVDDILRVRVTTVGVTEHSFRAEDLAVRMVDVGGQRAEREKWIEAFGGVTAVIFVAAVSEYDQTLAEDPSQNRLVEAYELWDAVVNSKWFADASILLFLNKKDLFRRKILARRDFATYHPEYRPPRGASPEDEYDDVCEWITARFLRLNRGKTQVYPFFTCATDTRNIASVFQVVRETLLAANMRTAGIM